MPTFPPPQSKDVCQSCNVHESPDDKGTWTCLSCGCERRDTKRFPTPAIVLVVAGAATLLASIPLGALLMVAALAVPRSQRKLNCDNCGGKYFEQTDKKA